MSFPNHLFVPPNMTVDIPSVADAKATRTTLAHNWQFSQVASKTWADVKEEWTECSVPTSVHVELEKQGRIPDPYKGLNEWEVQCESTPDDKELTRQGSRRPTGRSRRPSPPPPRSSRRPTRT